MCVCARGWVVNRTRRESVKVLQWVEKCDNNSGRDNALNTNTDLLEAHKRRLRAETQGCVE